MWFEMPALKWERQENYCGFKASLDHEGQAGLHRSCLRKMGRGRGREKMMEEGERKKKKNMGMFKMWELGAGKMAEATSIWCSSRDPSLFPNTHVRWFTAVYNPSCRGSITSSGLWGHPHTCAHTHRHIQINYFLKAGIRHKEPARDYQNMFRTRLVEVRKLKKKKKSQVSNAQTRRPLELLDPDHPDTPSLR